MKLTRRIGTMVGLILFIYDINIHAPKGSNFTANIQLLRMEKGEMWAGSGKWIDSKNLRC